jgi:uncharacterized protein YqhQ
MSKADIKGAKVAKDKDTHKTKIGGQALFEGVMMRSLTVEAMAVRKKDGTIHIETKTLPPGKWYQKAPFVRGVFNFVIQIKNGYQYMMKSMDVSGFLDDDDEDENKSEAVSETDADEIDADETDDGKEEVKNDE